MPRYACYEPSTGRIKHIREFSPIDTEGYKKYLRYGEVLVPVSEECSPNEYIIVDGVEVRKNSKEESL